MANVHLTVAVVVPQDGKYLMVYERDKTSGLLVYNQPAGHVEAGESITDAAIRECLEETSWQVQLTGLIGIYTLQAPNGIDYCRICFAAKPLQALEDLLIDPDIEQACWLSLRQLKQKKLEMRSSLVLQCIQDFEKGKLKPLSIFK